MKNVITYFLIGLLFGGIVSCSKEKPENNNKVAVPIALSHNEKLMVISNNEFGFDIFRKIDSNDTSGKNLFISPLSISLALAMTYNGANGQTATEMQNTLKFPNLAIADINGYFQKLSGTLVSIDPKVEFDIANSIWYRQGFSVIPDFLSINQSYYNAQVQALDFTSQDAVNTINHWVSDKTHERIPTVIDQIDPYTVMFLINAIYFKGKWTYEFEKDGTHEETFFLGNSEQLTTPMMKQKGSFSYYANEKFKAVEMPYGQQNFTMIVFLPEEGHTVSEIVDDMTPDNWAMWTNNLQKQNVDILFPRFKFKYERMLNNDLINLGMVKAFSPDEADFTKITKINPGDNLYISFVKHNSFVEVNETGTEAAAVTVVAVNLMTSIGPGPVTYYPFIVNKPFIFAIRETTTNTVIFLGKILNPKNE